MREVEERLGKPDTGEETRKRQAEIVKNLDQLIEQMKNAPSQASGLKMIREGKKPGRTPASRAINPAPWRRAGNPMADEAARPQETARPRVALAKSRSGASSPPSSATTWTMSWPSIHCRPSST